MHRTPKLYLYDTAVAANEILRMVERKSLDDYLRDAVLQAAVERKFIALGEALYQMRHRFPQVLDHIPAARSLIAFRHVLVHGYDQVADDLTWGVIETRVRPALEAAERMLNDGRLP